MQVKFASRLTVATVALMSLCGATLAAPAYTVQQVHPELAGMFGTAFNDKAKVAATIKNKKGKFVGAVCSTTTCTEVPVLAGAPKGSAASLRGIDKVGHVVGNSPTAKTYAHAILFDGVETKDLGAFPEDDCGGCSLISYAYGMNSKGQVVGSSQTGDGGFQGFVWKDGVMTKLPTLGGWASGANAINERGVAVGSAVVEETGYGHAVIYRKGKVQDLGVLGTGSGSTAWDINNLDVVVGDSTTDGPNGERPFIYSAGEMKQLPLPANALNGSANRINDAGWVIGGYLPMGDSHGRAWVNDGHEVYDLNTLIPAADQAQWIINGATDINASGQILVHATKPSDLQTTYTLILTPTAN